MSISPYLLILPIILNISNYAFRSTANDIIRLPRIRLPRIKPPVFQFKTCVMLEDCPHGHLDGSPFKSFPYRKFIASRNFFLFSTKLYSSRGTAESQFDAPGSFASLTARSSAGERNCSVAAALIFNFYSRFIFSSSLSVLT